MHSSREGTSFQSLLKRCVTLQMKDSVLGSLNVSFCLEHHPNASYPNHFAFFFFSCTLALCHQEAQINSSTMSPWGYCPERFPPQHSAFFMKTPGRNIPLGPHHQEELFCFSAYDSILFLFFSPLWMVCVSQRCFRLPLFWLLGIGVTLRSCPCNCSRSCLWLRLTVRKFIMSFTFTAIFSFLVFST